VTQDWALAGRRLGKVWGSIRWFEAIMRINLARWITACGVGDGLGRPGDQRISARIDVLSRRAAPLLAPQLIARHAAKALAGTALCLQLFSARSTHRHAYDSVHLASQARDTRGRLPFAEHRSVAPRLPLLGRIPNHKVHRVP
jgi:hypothetical protein